MTYKEELAEAISYATTFSKINYKNLSYDTIQEKYPILKDDNGKFHLTIITLFDSVKDLVDYYSPDSDYWWEYEDVHIDYETLKTML